MTLILRFIYLIAALFVIELEFNAQVSMQWAKGMGGAGNEEGHSVAVDAAGNVYTTGWFVSTVDFDPGPGIFTLTTVGSQNIFVTKFNSAGTFVWAKMIGGGGPDFCYSIALDAAGNIYTTGYYNSFADFDPGPGVYNLTLGGSFACKWDASGNFVWAKSINGVVYGRGLALDALGNVYTTGYYSGTSDFDPGPGVYNLSSAGNYDIYINKLDAFGNFVWAKNMGGGTSDKAFSIAVDASNNVYTTGVFTGIADFDPGVGVYNLSSVGGDEVFVSKLDVSGNFVWAKQLGGTGNEHGNSITVDAIGNVYTTGYFQGTTDFDPNVGTYYLASGGSGDAFISKLDASGTFVWAKNFGGGGGTVEGQSIVVDPSGNVYTTGFLSYINDFDPGPGTYILTSGGNYDIFISKLDASGSFVWAKNMGGIGNNITENFGYSIAIDSPGNIYITGKFCQTVDFDPGPNIYNIIAIANDDIFVEKFCQMASPTVATGGATSFCMGGSVVLTAGAANTYSWSTGATTQSILVIASGNYSVVVTNTSGCTATSPVISVTVNPLPTITVNSGSICSGNSFTIVPSGAYTYTISGGLTIVSPTVNTSYTVIGTSSLGCLSASPAISNITVNAFPLPTITVNSGVICSGNSFTINPNGANTYTISGGSAIVSPTANTSYTITGTSVVGCLSQNSAISNVTVSVMPLPTITVNSGSVCSGNSFTIIPTGANTYSITGGSTIVSPTVSSSYTVTGTSTTGCQSASPVVSNVTVLPLPIITATTSNTLICVGETATLSATGANSYTWNPGGTGTNILITPTINTSYTVAGTGLNGCLNIYVITQNVDLCTSNAKASISVNEIKIYPNPVNVKLFIEGSDLITNAELKIYDVIGKELQSEILKGEKNELNISGIITGVYYIKVTKDNKVLFTHKLIKQ